MPQAADFAVVANVGAHDSAISVQQHARPLSDYRVEVKTSHAAVARSFRRLVPQQLDCGLIQLAA
jgi:hypothetical protein